MNLEDLNRRLGELSKIGDGVNYNLSKKNLLDKKWWIDAQPKYSLQNSIISALDNYDFGKQDEVFIDITLLGQKDNNFFDFIANKLNEKIRKNKNSKVIIRYLEGNQSIDGNPIDGNSDNRGVTSFESLVKYNDNVELYFGNISNSLNKNNFKFIDMENFLKSIISEDKLKAEISKQNLNLNYKWKDIEDIIKSTLKIVSETLTNFPDFLAGNYFGWNHSKIFAINGDVLIQGVNFWNDYNSQGTPYDLATTTTGEATGNAHSYCNYLWDFLSSNSHAGTNSLQSYSRNDKKFIDVMRVKNYNSTSKSYEGNTHILSANNLGTLSLSIDPAKYFLPLFDLVMNAFMYVLQNKFESPFLNKIILYIVYTTHLKDYLPFKNHMYTFYAGRYVRNYAIKNANYSIKLSQQKLVLDDIKDLIKSIQKKLNTFWNIKKTPDGLLWGYDFLYSLIKASKNVKNIDIISSLRQDGGYGDPISADEFKRVFKSLGGDDSKINYRRINTNASRSNHSKLTIVDNKVLHIGSENIYVSYNQQFGIWIDDKNKINTFITDYWDKIWSNSKS